MVDLAMSIFEFLTKFLVFWHPWHPWVCIRSDLNPLFETDMSDSSYCTVNNLFKFQVQNSDFVYFLGDIKSASHFLKKLLLVLLEDCPKDARSLKIFM